MAKHLSIILLICTCIAILQPCKAIKNSSNGNRTFPAILIFGDSSVDTGNNNYIATAFKANNRPYGIDFPRGVATGRFSNGRLVSDFLASALGIKQNVPPSLQPGLSDQDLLTGVSFASAGSGFDLNTTIFTQAIPVSEQPGMFRNYISRITKIVGKEKAKTIVNDSLVLLSAGTNDFLFNYYDIRTRRLQFNISMYQDYIQNELQKFLKAIYDQGSRFMMVAGLPPIGCLPIQMTAMFQDPIHRRCVDSQNADAQSYNGKLIKLLHQAQASLPGSIIEYADIYTPLMDTITNPQKYGFEVTKRGCCGTGSVETAILCSVVSPVCPDRTRFVFWDSVHPTQSIYSLISNNLISNVIPRFHNSTAN